MYFREDTRDLNCLVEGRSLMAYVNRGSRSKGDWDMGKWRKLKTPGKNMADGDLLELQ